MKFKYHNFYLVVVWVPRMSISDISEIWQNHEFSEDMIPGPPSLLDQLAFGVYIRPLNDDELVVELEDDPYHSYKVEKRDEV